MNDINKIIALIFSQSQPGANDIMYALSLKGYSPTKVADECGVDRTTVIHVIYGNKRSWNVATKISAILNISLPRIFGDAYDYTPRVRQKQAANG